MSRLSFYLSIYFSLSSFFLSLLFLSPAFLSLSLPLSFLSLSHSQKESKLRKTLGEPQIRLQTFKFPLRKQRRKIFENLTDNVVELFSPLEFVSKRVSLYFSA